VTKRFGYEWFVAWRHLREHEGRRSVMIWAGVTLSVFAGVARIAAARIAPGALGEPAPLQRALIVSAVVLLAAAVVFVWLGVLLRLFSVFTSISVFGVFLGTCALVIVLSVMSGFEGDLRGKILGTRAHASVDVPGGVLADYRRVLAAARSDRDVVAAQPVIESEVMILSPSNHQVVSLRGVDPAAAARVTEIARYLKAPCGGGKIDYLDRPADLARATNGETRPVLPGVLLGCELGKRLRVFVGDDVQLVAPRGGLGPMGPMPRARSFRVAGIFYSGMYEYDSKLILSALSPAQRLLGRPDEVTAVELRLRDPERTEGPLGRLRATLGPGHEVTDWREANRSLFSALKLEKAAMFIVLGFIVLVASFSIVTNLIMVVLQKGREIAVLKAMGSTSGAVLRIFVIEGLYIGAIGLLAGVATGVGVCLLLERYGIGLDPDVYYIARLPVVLDGTEVALIALSALGISLLATAYPSWLASRLHPADGIRYD
jgi:lipoprotein-releasing system permease protein